MLRSLVELLPSALWVIDSEPIGARGIIAKSTVNSSRLRKKEIYIYLQFLLSRSQSGCLLTFE